ncbi:MAG: Uncharacterised protein [Halieaceae bacterium]|nr:MAG: Uncharacterised protein [Halieaceae bacterium]
MSYISGFTGPGRNRAKSWRDNALPRPLLCGGVNARRGARMKQRRQTIAINGLTWCDVYRIGMHHLAQRKGQT